MIKGKTKPKENLYAFFIVLGIIAGVFIFSWGYNVGLDYGKEIECQAKFSDELKEILIKGMVCEKQLEFIKEKLNFKNYNPNYVWFNVTQEISKETYHRIYLNISGIGEHEYRD